MTHQPLSSTSKPCAASGSVGEVDSYTFRAPRHEDLARCPFCPNAMLNRLRCEYCGGEGVVFKGTVQ
ncbi:hypothetical protein [uncultured Brevundimonas sp.]|uniref:hypothetical protein n=1 Tax=uncultured Brevundimonas sp. TaxID=213418 RepID=UPI00262CEBC1|nr:hypothetical protein [uncultured Brevundimonas sp.]